MAEKLIVDNRKARHDYQLLERVEAGLVLTGTEVKSLRDGRATLGQAYADVRDGEAWLHGAEIAIYDQGNRANHEPTRTRKLLLHRREIDRLYGQVREKGLTLVPTRLYFKDGRVKVELALARGKDVSDKRRTLADRDAKRQIERAMKAAPLAPGRVGERRATTATSAAFRPIARTSSRRPVAWKWSVRYSPSVSEPSMPAPPPELVELDDEPAARACRSSHRAVNGPLEQPFRRGLETLHNPRRNRKADGGRKTGERRRRRDRQPPPRGLRNEQAPVDPGLTWPCSRSLDRDRVRDPAHARNGAPLSAVHEHVQQLVGGQSARVVTPLIESSIEPAQKASSGLEAGSENQCRSRGRPLRIVKVLGVCVRSRSPGAPGSTPMPASAASARSASRQGTSTSMSSIVRTPASR